MMHQHNFNPAIRGLHAVYRPGETNVCPGCGRSHWDIRLTTAECSFCSTALPINTETQTGRPAFFTRFSRKQTARGRFTVNGRAA